MADTVRDVGARIADAIAAACAPAHVDGVAAAGPVLVARRPTLALARLSERPRVDTDVSPQRAAAVPVPELVVQLFDEQGEALVRLARLFVDDRDAAEDLVQEAFIRLARSADRVRDRARAPAYLRSIVLNLARDHNRRGLVSLRHRTPADPAGASLEDEVVLDEDRRMVIDALRELPLRQRTCLVLRYYEELPVDEIADVLGISRNSVKTHLSRGLAAMQARL